MSMTRGCLFFFIVFFFCRHLKVFATPFDIYSSYGLEYFPPKPQESRNGLSVFLHACLGLHHAHFGHGHGNNIFHEMLQSLLVSGLMTRNNTNIFLTLLGSPRGIQGVAHTISEFNKTAGNIHVVIRGRNMSVAEFPTIYALRSHAVKSHDESKILYLHTKGVRNQTTSCVHCSDYWRRYMEYFMVDNYELCLEALDTGYGSCGVQFRVDPSPHYSGNFWWASAHWLKYRTVDFEKAGIPWDMDHRFTAEFFLLASMKKDEELYNTWAQHKMYIDKYCLFNLPKFRPYECPTKKVLYTNVKLLPGKHNCDWQRHPDDKGFCMRLPPVQLPAVSTSRKPRLGKRGNETNSTLNSTLS